MSKELLSVTIGTSVRTFPRGTALYKIAEEYQSEYPYEIVLAVVNDKLEELHTQLEEDAKIRFVTIGEKLGNEVYRRSTAFLFIKAVYDVAGKENVGKVLVHFSVDHGIYYTIEGEGVFDAAFYEKVEAHMHEIVEKNYPIWKKVLHKNESIALFEEYHNHGKRRLYHYRTTSRTTVYGLQEFQDNFYGSMCSFSGTLKYFKLYPFGDGVVLQMPIYKEPTVVPEFCPREKLFAIQQEADKVGEFLKIGCVGELNDCMVEQGAQQLILVQEAIQEKQIASIASRIAADPAKKFVLIAGPSSSGKTTFSMRLSVQLSANGKTPHAIAVDNYFVNREDTPVDENGKLNYECLGAIDVELFNRDLTDLLAGKTVEIPSFNFKEGRREYKGDFMTLGEDDILVIEGIHCLNDKLTHSLSKDNKYKIYVSALTQLNVDEHNHISTTDGRLLRRIVRDSRCRGTSAKDTIAMWDSVRRGEKENIFPYQEDADVMFNSALLYEFSVLKPYAEQVLYNINEGCEEYYEARRLLKFLDCFVAISSDKIPQNSLLREFIGGGCFGL